MDKFNFPKTLIDNINEQNDRINECVDIVNGYTTDEETRVNQEIERQQNEEARQEQYNNIKNNFDLINEQLDNIETKKANKDIVRLKNVSIDLDDMSERTLQAIQGGEGTSFTLSSIPRNGSVDYEKTTFFNVEKSINVFDKKAITDIGYIIDVYNKGVLVANDNGAISDYIIVKPGDSIKTNTTWTGAFYDINMNFISGKEFGTTSFTVPDNCSYYRQNVNTINLDTTMICINNELPSTYEEYNEIITKTDKFKNVIFNDYVVTPEVTSFLKTELKNLFNKNTTTDGYVLDNNGELTTNSVGCVSDYIEILPNTLLYFSTNWNGAYYDKDKKFIKLKEYGILSDTSPNNCKYIRVSLNLDKKDTYMLSYNPIDKYYEYGKYISFNNVYIETLVDQLLSTGKFNKSSLNGKTWAVVGDSLTEINQATTKHYYDYISEETGIKVLNYGVGGTGYMKGYDSNKAFYQRVLNISTNVDIITIFGSGNDLGLGIDKLGDIYDTDTTTICGCMNKTLDNLFQRFPTIPIGVIAPTPWQYNPATVPNNKMEQYVEKLEAICKRRGVKYLDLYHNSLLRPEDETNKQLCFYNDAALDGNGDGVHPNELGHKIIYPSFREFIKTLI